MLYGYRLPPEAVGVRPRTVVVEISVNVYDPGWNSLRFDFSPAGTTVRIHAKRTLPKLAPHVAPRGRAYGGNE